jgi:predicted pyridoxine 5'-phosphate oxidase superfamily flavin-nucleotide-binding protein
MGTLIKKIEINSGMKKLIEEQALGLASVDKKGIPHNMAVGFVKVIEKDKLLISDNYIQETLINIKSNPNVSLVVWTCDWKENCVGYELAGKAEYFTSGKYLEMMKKIPENDGAPCKGAIVITINKIKVLD